MTAIHEPPPAPRPAEGIEMIGEYADSGFKEAPYIARRADGQTLQLTNLLYSVASHADGQRDHAAIAEAVSQDIGRNVSADNIRFLVEKKLRPLGVLAAADGSSPDLERPDPLLALRFRTAVVPEGFTRMLTTVFRPLFWPPALALVIAAFLALDAWLFLHHGIAQGLRHAISSGRPSLTPERERELGGAPTARELEGDRRLDSKVVGKAERPVEKREPRGKRERRRSDATPTPTREGRATPSATATPGATAAPAATATATPTPTVTAAPTAEATATPTPVVDAGVDAGVAP